MFLASGLCYNSFLVSVYQKEDLWQFMNAVTAANVGANTAAYLKKTTEIFTAAGQSALPAVSTK